MDEYVKLHAALRKKLPRDPARVEGFFYPFEKDRKKPADGPAPIARYEAHRKSHRGVRDASR